ncbi:MAG: hypothetical protein JWN86_1927 [Planctomycetota bacterium]|nr:hypothetical protein [Planctomycetota bacterium]
MKAPTHTVTLSPPLRRLLHDHQIFCSADCCRERAFEITEGSISRWLDSERTDRTAELAAEIHRVASDVQGASGCVYLAVPGLKSEWGGDQFRTFWGHLRSTYSLAAEARQRARA